MKVYVAYTSSGGDVSKPLHVFALKEMAAAEFIELGRQIYGGHGWKTKLAKDVGKSFSAIKRMSYGDAKIQKLMADFLRTKARGGKA